VSTDPQTTPEPTTPVETLPTDLAAPTDLATPTDLAAPTELTAPTEWTMPEPAVLTLPAEPVILVDSPLAEEWPLPPAPVSPAVGLADAGPDTRPAPRRAASRGPSALRIVWVYPDLLSTYGDRGNLLILARRAARRGLPVETIEVRSDQPVPQAADIYLLGGGEDGPQALAADRLIADGGLRRAVDQRAVVFAVCAGYQLLGADFFAKGKKYPGLELLNISSDRGPTRAVGELAGEIDPALGLPMLTGFENHGGRTHVGPGAKPLAKVSVGIGNDGSTEGAWSGSVLGTYSHGPALSRNPAIADLLLRWATGQDELDPLDDTWPTRLRVERLASAKAG